MSRISGLPGFPRTENQNFQNVQYFPLVHSESDRESVRSTAVPCPAVHFKIVCSTIVIFNVVMKVNAVIDNALHNAIAGATLTVDAHINSLRSLVNSIPQVATRK